MKEPAGAQARIEFISLIDSIRLVATTAFGQGEQESAPTSSEAAGAILGALTNLGDQAPRWMRLPPSGFPRIDESVRTMGLELLALAETWAGRESEDLARHFRECRILGIDAADAPRSFNPDRGMFGKYQLGALFEAAQVGFVRSEFDLMLAPLRDARAQSMPAGAPAAGAIPASETKEARQSRRFDRLRALGGDRVRSGTTWKASGDHGALARLAREEQAAGRPYSDEKSVRTDVNAEADRRLSRKALGTG